MPTLRSSGRTPASAAVRLLAVVAAAGAGVTAGIATAPSSAPRSNPVVLRGNVPVGVEHTSGGAAAAADNYIAAENRALVSPAQLRAVVDTDWLPQARGRELAAPFPKAALTNRPDSIPGLKLTAAVAADRVDAYSAQTAQVRVWDEFTVWSESVAPTQRWSLDRIALVWRSGRWMVASRSAAPEAQTPVPTWTSGSPVDRTSPAFDARLAGMSQPYYGATP